MWSARPVEMYLVDAIMGLFGNSTFGANLEAVLVGLLPNFMGLKQGCLKGYPVHGRLARSARYFSIMPH